MWCNVNSAFKEMWDEDNNGLVLNSTHLEIMINNVQGVSIQSNVWRVDVWRQGGVNPL